MIAAALAEQGAEIPEDLRSVDVWPTAELYRDAFRVLSAARQHAIGMGGSAPQPIPYSEIVTYADRNGFADSIEELEEFVTLIQVQDAAYLSGVAKAREKK